METEMAREMVQDFSASALRQIEQAARQRADILANYGDQYEATAEGPKYRADQMKFFNLAAAINDLLSEE